MSRKVFFKSGQEGFVSEDVFNVLLRKGEIVLDRFDQPLKKRQYNRRDNSLVEDTVNGDSFES